MCNDYRNNVDLDTIVSDFSDLRIKINFPDGAPNIQPQADIRITDVAPIIQAGVERGTANLVQRRWSWPGHNGKPVYNFRSDSRAFARNRCLIITDGFYEFTDSEPTPDAPKKKLKNKWLFTLRGHKLFCIAGIYRTVPEIGEAFTMLTTEPGPDIAPYHDRQVVVLPRERWAAWLDPQTPADQVLTALPAGSLIVEQVR